MSVAPAPVSRSWRGRALSSSAGGRQDAATSCNRVRGSIPTLRKQPVRRVLLVPGSSSRTAFARCVLPRQAAAS